MAGPFPLLLVAHVVLAIALFLPSFLLPFGFQTRRRAVPSTPATSSSPITRSLLWLQSNGTLIIGAGVTLTGIGLVGVIGTQVLSQPWLLAALTIYGVNLALAFFIQRPGLRRLLRLPSGSTEAEHEHWRALARRQRYVSYVMAGTIGIIAFLMSTKPALW